MHLQRRILVTGGSGFLGSHLCEKLHAQNANVLCVDSFFTGNRQNIEHFALRLFEHRLRIKVARIFNHYAVRACSSLTVASCPISLYKRCSPGTSQPVVSELQRKWLHQTLERLSRRLKCRGHGPTSGLDY